MQPMNYVLWVRTPHTLAWAPQVLWNRADGRLTEHEQRRAIGGPILVAANHEGLPLQELARLYPCPGSPASAALEKARKAQAIADDPGAQPEERASARAVAERLREEKRT